MATRRIVATEKTILDKDEADDALAAGGRSDITPAVPRDVIIKLLGFTAAMVVAPIGSYFATVDTLFKGNSTYAGATAAIVANVVLVAYVVVAMNEDQGDPNKAEPGSSKKDQ